MEIDSGLALKWGAGGGEWRRGAEADCGLIHPYRSPHDVDSSHLPRLLLAPLPALPVHKSTARSQEGPTPFLPRVASVGCFSRYGG